MTIATSSIWDGIENAEIFERGKYMAPAFDGVVEIRRTIVKPTRASGLAFIVEFEIIETNLPTEHPVGTKATWFQKLIDKDIAFPSVAAWAAACAGYEPHQREEIKEKVRPILKDLMNMATEKPDTNDFIGTRLCLVTTLVDTKKGTPFTRYDFSPVPSK